MIKILILFAVFTTAQQLEQNNIVLIVLSQESTYNNGLAEELKENVTKQAIDLSQDPPKIYFSHLDFPHLGGWTVLPILPEILDFHENDVKWFLFCQDVTRFNLSVLLNTLDNYDHKKEIWIGHALQDQEATIIHHFAFFEDPKSFSYPNFASGFVISMPLFKKIESRVYDFLQNNEMEFSIDVSHELSLFILNKFGVKLTNEPNFCIHFNPNCASYVKSFVPCKKPLSTENIFFAVKTCKKFHKDRVPVVKNTWGKHLTKIGYFSEENDSSIPTVDLKVRNTRRGHCAKTMAIVQYVAEKMKKDPTILWLTLADDDTILSPYRLSKFLACFDPSDPIMIGERYGYTVYLGEGRGYNYITGGGGIALGRLLVMTLAEEGMCDCPGPEAPDDMYLAVCTVRIGGDIIHSPAFHQARPPDYATGYLESHGAVSFHKHWMVDPYKVYSDWFLQDDLNLSENISYFHRHSEL